MTGGARRSAVVVFVLLMLATSCTAADTSSPDTDSTGSTDEAAAAAFCQDADAFITDDSVTSIDSFGPDFFADVEQRLSALVDRAPTEVTADFEALRTGFRTSEEVFSRFAFDASDPALVPALDEIDQAAMLEATDNIQQYLDRECRAFIRPADGPVDEAQVADIMEAFSVDRTMAECLNRELGDIANIDSSELTQELLSMPVCGTSLIGLLTGTG